MGSKCKTESGSWASSPSRGPSRLSQQQNSRCPSSLSQQQNPDFSSDDDSDDEVPEVSEVSFDVCGSIRDVTLPSIPLTQKKRLVPYYGVHCDKESLLEEVLALLDAFQDQKFHFGAHKAYHDAVHAENSRLERHIEFLETSGLEAPRTGTLTKLKSKLKGCKTRLVDLETTCCSNPAEIRRLRVHAQVMKTQEAIVQRDMFALEVRRLQKSINVLRNMYKTVTEDNKEAVRLKEETAVLTTKNQELETSVSEKTKNLEAMATELAEWRAKGSAAREARASDIERFKTLQDDMKSLMDLLFAEKLAKANFNTIVNTLGHQVRVVERENREKEAEARQANA